ncbi:MAG: pentapeptide repeat-containing protein, partial [Roseibacillus sp.]|nr:pentapeptide repeat-containing protein [Roseibacillus sp.]
MSTNEILRHSEPDVNRNSEEEQTSLPNAKRPERVPFLFEATLTDAVLTGAILTRTVLLGADLENADFTNATLTRTIL